MSVQAVSASERDSSVFRDVTHHVSAEIRPSYIMPTHGFYNGWNSLGRPLRAGGSAHLKYSFTFAQDTRPGHLYPASYQGIGLSVNTFFAHGMLGTPVAVYLFQGAPVASIGPRLTLDYEWNFGLSFGWKAYDGKNSGNVDDMVVGSSANAYINVGIFLSYVLNDCWKLTAGPEYTHFSNGDTRFPNGGANTVSLRMGATRSFGHSSSGKTITDMFGKKKQALTWDLTAYGAWRADRLFSDNKLHLINKAFPVAGINVNPLYHFSNSLSAGASLDLMYDGSANLEGSVEDDVLTLSYPSFMKQCAAGVSLRGEVAMPIFAINIGVGYNFLHMGEDLKGIYGIFALKTRVSERFFIHIGYRLSSVLYCHNLMFGLGWRIYHDNITARPHAS